MFSRSSIFYIIGLYVVENSHFFLLLQTRCPETAKVKQKMLYSSSYEALKRSLVGIYKYIQACEFEEASQATIEDAFKSKK